MVAKKKAKSTTKAITTKAKKKSAIARVTVKKGRGNIRINGKSFEVYGNTPARREIMGAFDIAEEVLGQGFEQALDINVNVRGGGWMGQAEATRVAIAKALVAWTKSDNLKDTYLKYGRHNLVDDVRRKEPKKPLRKGARARWQKSYR